MKVVLDLINRTNTQGINSMLKYVQLVIHSIYLFSKFWILIYTKTKDKTKRGVLNVDEIRKETNKMYI